MSDLQKTQDQLLEEVRTPRDRLAALERAEAERGRAEAALTEARQRLQFLVSATPAVIYGCKPSGDYGATYVSENVAAQLGYDAREFVEDSGFWASRVHPEDLPRVLAGLSSLSDQGGHTHTHEYRFRHKDGTYRWMHDELRVVRHPDGRPEEIVGFWIDITERKRAQLQLEENEHRLRVALTTANIAAFTQDRDFRYTWMCRPQLGYTTQEVVGKTDADLLPPECLPAIAAIKRRALETGKLSRGEVAVAMRGKVFLYDLLVEPTFDEAGEVVGITGASLDITERRRLEGELRQAQKMEAVGRRRPRLQQPADGHPGLRRPGPRRPPGGPPPGRAGEGHQGRRRARDRVDGTTAGPESQASAGATGAKPQRLRGRYEPDAASLDRRGRGTGHPPGRVRLPRQG
jgi:PAS domain S-box-containing protein